MDPNNVEGLRAAWRALAGALMQAGLLGSTLGRYTRRFLHVSSAILCVERNFPRLTRANVHSVVRKARYEIDLDLTGAEKVDLERALELMGVT